MKQEARELSDDEIKDFIKLIGVPTFRYLMKRINNNILLDKSNSDMSINSFISTLVITMASIDANLLKWIAVFYKEKIGKEIDFEKLQSSLIRNLHEQVGIKLH